MARKAMATGPSAPGSKDIPEGKPNCLAGLKFVFTGELSSLSREEAVELAKRYGACVCPRLPGCRAGLRYRLLTWPPALPSLGLLCSRGLDRAVTGAPSGATSYVVVGANAGQSKLTKIATIGCPTLDEDGFLELIGSRGSGQLDEKQKKKQKEEEAKIKRVAREMEEAEREDDRKRVKLEKEAEKARQAELQAAMASSASAGPSASSSKKPAVRAAPLCVQFLPGRSEACERARTRTEASLLDTRPLRSKVPPPASSQLWTTKYAPTSISQVLGNKTTVEKLTDWLGNWCAPRPATPRALLSSAAVR